MLLKNIKISNDYNIFMIIASRKPSLKDIYKIIKVSKFDEPADLIIEDASYIDIYTKRISSGNIAIASGRIAYIGDEMPLKNNDTRIIKNDFLIAPGYIEGHAHPFQIYNPVTFNEIMIRHGTSMVISDDLPMYIKMGLKNIKRFMRFMGRLPVKNFWSVRLDSQSMIDMEKFSYIKIKELLNDDYVLQAGEITGWPYIINMEKNMLKNIYNSQFLGKRIETHNPGASKNTLNRMAAAGITSDHEAITGEDVKTRLSLGYHVFLRYSSIRKDLKDELKYIIDEKLPLNRLMLTNDGSPYYNDYMGMDDLIKIAISAGLNPFDAYSMASLNPAVYYNIDGIYGGIAPGRLADMNFIRDLYNPEPVFLMLDGKIIDKEVKLDPPDWKGYGMLYKNRNIDINKINFNGSDETLFMRNQVIMDLNKYKMEDSMEIHLITKDLKRIVSSNIHGMGHFDALASSYNIEGSYIVIGSSHDLMKKALKEVIKNGGIVFNGNKNIRIELKILGIMSDKHSDDVRNITEEFRSTMRGSGYKFDDPVYSMLFLNSINLPYYRITSSGIVEVKTRKIIKKPVSLKI
ncbi:Adenine deaminase [Picrophilus oshimae DSM 9789]|uniref:adenine deaminase n=2 Tax=Picrophilus oshimae TaxID=46632 RepID=A0A8G2FXH5_PICTO|nr:Adenine deaminase [Picrophilus oshimae DSM 9789]